MTLLGDPPSRTSNGGTPSEDGGGPPRRNLLLIVLALCAAAIAVALGGFGSKALYMLGGLLVVIAGAYAIRDTWSPHITDAMQRIRPVASGAHPHRPARSAVTLLVVSVVAAGLAFLLAHSSTKILLALAGLLGLGISIWLLWPAIRLLFDTVEPGLETSDREEVAAKKEQQWKAIGLGRTKAPKPPAGKLSRIVAILLYGIAASIVAFLAAKMGSKALLVLVGLVVVGGCLARARDKTLFAVFGMVCSMAFLVHKTFGPLDLTLAGGAPSVYISSFDAMVVLLYALWVREGTFWSDVRQAFQRRIMWLPLIGPVSMLPSLLAAQSNGWLGVAELVRMGWMYLLFVYVAVRVRNRALVWAILGGLAAFAAVEILVVLMQWKTGGVLGLSFLGVPTQLTQRITDSSELGRPFGTIIHPDFMGATMGAIALVSLSVGLNLRRSLLKVASMLLSVGCVVCLYLAHTRTALAAWVAVFLVTIVVSIARGSLKWRTVGRVLIALLLVGAVFFPQLDAHYKENFGTGHFSEEIKSRYQLNDVAIAMFEANPIIGVGLNTFQDAMGPYEEGGVIFIDNPVQNLYLLYLSETGIIGMVGFVMVAVGMFQVAVRLERSADRLFSGIGLGVTAAMSFLAIEELMDFALRQDVPLATYWLLAGLAVACREMAGPTRQRRTRISESQDL